MAKQSLFDIANQYGQGSDFGHYDAEIAKGQGYSNQDILDFLDSNPGKLAAGNKSGGQDGLYDELRGNSLDFGKSVVANRGGASGAEIAESNAQRDQQFGLDRIAAAGNVNLNIQRLINSANMYAADSTATWQMYGADAAKDASIYSADVSERSAAYVADVDRAKAREVETIRGSFGLQLQSIVNAGAKEAEAVRGEYQLANTDLTGQYGLENTRIAGATARDVANSNKEGQILGSLMSGFWS